MLPSIKNVTLSDSFWFLGILCFWTELENLKNKKKQPTFDFPCSISVYNLSQFTTQDLWRKLIFTLKGVKSVLGIQALNRKWELLSLCVCVLTFCIL